MLPCRKGHRVSCGIVQEHVGCSDIKGLSCFRIEFREVGAGSETQSFPSASSDRHDFRDEVIDGEGTRKDTEEYRGRGKILSISQGSSAKGCTCSPEVWGVVVDPE